MALFHRGSPVLYCGKSAVFVKEDEEGTIIACRNAGDGWHLEMAVRALVRELPSARHGEIPSNWATLVTQLEEEEAMQDLEEILKDLFAHMV